ncbi:MAG TPA: ATP-binding protein [Acidimicrobiia bacterium]|nr:ATP-binding protein [Acidimicrobiia bacterium]
MTGGAWTDLADVRLQRAALLARIAWDRVPDPLAGLRIDDHDVDRLLAELPGTGGDACPELDSLNRLLSPMVEEAEQAFAAALDCPTRFAVLARRMRLTPLDAQVLAVLCAVEMDPRRQRLVAYLNDDVSQRRVTPFVLDQLFGATAGAAAAVGPGSRLEQAALLRTDAATGPWASTPITLAPAVAWWLAGVDAPEPHLHPGTARIERLAEGHCDLAVVAGPDRVRRLEAAGRALRPPTCLTSPVPTTVQEWDALVRTATLEGAGVILECDGELDMVGRNRIQMADHLSWALTSPHDLPLSSLPRRHWVAVVPAPAAATDAEWRTAFKGAGRRTRHPLTAEQLELAAGAARAAGGDVAAGVRRLAAGRIDQLASRIRPSRSWDDLVLPPDRLTQVHEVALRYRHRGVVYDAWDFKAVPSAGVLALFSGPSGTGKTMAAEIVAGAVGVDLYKVDLSQLVSKYIGETEKNLAEIFDAAEASNVVLLFDEADALLGKRSEVSDAHDRYANIEVAYLLQRIERHNGVVVMSSNLPKNIDAAFARRIHVFVDFPMPALAERRRIWERSLPSAAPTVDLDLGFLAERFELSGGSIRNVALSAAFFAAEAGTPITMATLLLGLQRELDKLGRLVPLDAFGRYADLLCTPAPTVGSPALNGAA